MSEVQGWRKVTAYSDVSLSYRVGEMLLVIVMCLRYRVGERLLFTVMCV